MPIVTPTKLRSFAPDTFIMFDPRTMPQDGQAAIPATRQRLLRTSSEDRYLREQQAEKYFASPTINGTEYALRGDADYVNSLWAKIAEPKRCGALVREGGNETAKIARFAKVDAHVIFARTPEAPRDAAFEVTRGPCATPVGELF